MKSLGKVKKALTLILAITLVAVGSMTQTVYASQAKETKADIITIPGDLEITSVPSFNFLVDSNALRRSEPVAVQGGYVYSRYYYAEGTINGNFVIEDARTTGKSWALKVSLGDFVNNTDSTRKLSGAELKMAAPTSVTSADVTNDFQGYPVKITAGSNVSQTIATSQSSQAQINLWEGKVPSASISIPSNPYLKGKSGVYKADMLWSIEDAP